MSKQSAAAWANDIATLINQAEDDGMEIWIDEEHELNVAPFGCAPIDTERVIW